MPRKVATNHIVSVRLTQEDLDLLNDSRMVQISTGIEMELPLATLIRQLAIAGCHKMREAKEKE